MGAKEGFQVLRKTLEQRVEFSKTLGHSCGFQSYYLQYSKHYEGSKGNKELYTVNNKQMEKIHLWFYIYSHFPNQMVLAFFKRNEQGLSYVSLIT